MKGYTGRILVVHLTEGTTQIKELPETLYRRVLSGVGLGVSYLIKNMPGNADPLGPENILGFVSGLLSGTSSYMTGRYLVVCKSPLTGGWGDANCGGYFSQAIKQCGFDAIFVHGASPKPVYLYIDNKGAKLLDAEKYWGLDTIETEEHIKSDLITAGIKKRPQIASIGAAGENLSLISGICSDGGRIAARSGVGAVMGSKKLKAVVLTGSKPVGAYDTAGLKKISKEFSKKMRKAKLPGIRLGGMLGFAGTVVGKSKMSGPMDGGMAMMLLKRWGTPMNTPMSARNGDAPIKNWLGSSKDISGRFLSKFNPDKILDREVVKYHCGSCALGCGGIVNIEDIGDGKYTHTHKPEYETLCTFGLLIMNNDMDSIYYVNELLNRAGMDTISAGCTVAYAIESFESGLISKEQLDGLELRWGNSAAVVKLIEKMIHREGVGAYFTDGVKKAYEHFGDKTLPAAIHIGGQEPGMHDCRMDPQLGAHFAADATPGRHTVGSRQGYNFMALNLICSWAPKAEAEKKDELYIPKEKDGLISAASACYKMMLDGSGGCYFAMMMGNHHWKLVDYLNAATGWGLSGDEYMEIGKRIQTMRQLFNVKHNVPISSWALPPRLEGRPPLKEGPLRGRSLQNEKMIQYYWKALGWDEKTGVPKPETVDALEINSVLEEAKL